MTDGKKKNTNINGRKSHKGNAPPTESRVNISVIADKARGVVRMQFANPIAWVEFDPLAVANVMKILGDKLAELQA